MTALLLITGGIVLGIALLVTTEQVVAMATTWRRRRAGQTHEGQLVGHVDLGLAVVEAVDAEANQVRIRLRDDDSGDTRGLWVFTDELGTPGPAEDAIPAYHLPKEMKVWR